MRSGTNSNDLGGVAMRCGTNNTAFRCVAVLISMQCVVVRCGADINELRCAAVLTAMR